MKKIGLGVLAFLILGGILFFCFYHHGEDETWEEYEKKRIAQFNEDDACFLIYGEQCELSEDLNWRHIDTLDEETLVLDNDFVFLFIIDREGEMDADSSTFETLKKIADKNMNFSFYYIGFQQLNNVKKAFPNYQYDPGRERSFAYVLFEGGKIMESGNWTTQEEEIIADGNNGEELERNNIYSFAEDIINEYKNYAQQVSPEES
ncbi:MAG: hypothetical protein IKS10_09120 [Lachnospiraceae bacterium]|nr:hypothetical protein [Lachnospiraceae bacterium]